MTECSDAMSAKHDKCCFSICKYLWIEQQGVYRVTRTQSTVADDPRTADVLWVQGRHDARLDSIPRSGQSGDVAQVQLDGDTAILSVWIIKVCVAIL